jgi:phosphoserine aminotransferase
MSNYGRIHNFTAGPAVLPLSVVEEVRDALPNLHGSGLGLLEISHRSKTFQAVVDSAVARVRRVLSVPEDYPVLFLQGGASLQFYMTALNFINPGPNGEKGAADFLVTGTWSQKAVKEASRVGDAKAIWDDAPNNFRRVPLNGEYTVRERRSTCTTLATTPSMGRCTTIIPTVRASRSWLISRPTSPASRST